ncbi:MAG: tetratricopeptide repeat protein, partial [Terriglobia bacterium]
MRFTSFGRAALPLLIAITAASPMLRADVADNAWKDLVMQGLYAAGANDFAKAEIIFRKALHEAEHFGAEDPRVGTTLNSVGLVYRSEKKFAEATAAFQQASAILEKAYGAQSIDVANSNYNIATALLDQGREADAIGYLRKCLLTYQKQFGGASLKTASVLCMIGDSYRLQRSPQEAEAPLKRCAQIREASGGLISAALGEALNSLALVYQQEGKFVLADQEFRLAEKIRERVLGITNPAFADTLEA